MYVCGGVRLEWNQFFFCSIWNCELYTFACLFCLIRCLKIIVLKFHMCDRSESASLTTILSVFVQSA